MVAIFTGAGTGYERGSAAVLGNMGLLGSASLGRGGDNVSVNAATGNLVISRQDEFLAGRGPDVGIARTYNHRGDLSDLNGDNWRQSTEKRIKALTGTLNTAGSTITRVGGDGAEVVYTYDAGKGVYVAKDGGGLYDTMRTSGPNDWVFTDGDTNIIERYTYANGYSAFGPSTVWRIANVADPEFVGGIQNLVTYAYLAGTDKVDTITTADLGYLKYGWSGNQVTKIEAYAAGGALLLTRVNYTYNAGRLEQVKVDLTPGDNSIADGAVYTTTYGYDGSGRVNSITQTDGSSLTLTYDGSNRVSTMTQTVAVGNTRVTNFTYGGVDTDGLTYTDITQSGLTTRMKYDGSNQLRKIVSPTVGGRPAQVVEFTYNANGDISTVKDQAGNSTTYSNYDSWGAWQTRTDRLGNVVTRTYAAAGRNQLLSETWTGSDASSASAAHTTRFVYDSEVHLRYKISAEGNLTEYQYDSWGRLTAQIEYPEHPYTGGASDLATMDTWVGNITDKSSVRRTDYTYDARGNMLTAKSWGYANSAGAGVATEGDSTINYVYDQAGQLLTTYRSGENLTSYLYDGLGRVYSTTAGNGTSTTIAFNDAATTTTVTLSSGRVTTSVYNKAGELLSVTDTGFSAATYSYDTLGRLRIATDSSGRSTYFYYDNVGRKVAEVSGDGASIATLKEFRYDQNNRLVATVSYANKALPTTYQSGGAIIEHTLTALRPTAHAGDVWEWRIYDAEDRLTGSIKGDGSTQAYGYDASNRLVTTTTYYNKIAPATITTYKSTTPTVLAPPTAHANDSVARTFYDKDGRLLGQLDGEGYLTRIYYDSAGQKTQELRLLTATPVSIAGQPTFRVTGTLDQLVANTATDANDRRTRYVYDGRLLRYVVDAFSRVTQFDYNPAGKVVQTIRYVGALPATGDYTFDNVKSLVAGYAQPSHADTRKTWSVYDAVGRLAYVLESEKVDGVLGEVAVVTGFVHDNQDRVVKTVRYLSRRPTASTPDFATMTSWSVGEIGNAANRISRAFYNARGDLVYSVDAENYVTLHEYDQAQRVTRARRYDTAQPSIADGTAIATIAVWVSGSTYADRQWEYDSAGRVSAEVDGLGARTTFNYWGNDLVQTRFVAQGTGDQVRYDYAYDAAGRLTQLQEGLPAGDATSIFYTYDGLGNLLTEQDRKGWITTRAYDRLGRAISQTDQVDASTNVTSYSQYDAFGNVVKATDARGNMTWNYYDRLDRLIVSRDAESYLTETSYNAFGDVSSVTRRYTADVDAPALNVVPSVPAHGSDATTSFLYDRLGRVTRATDAMGFYEEYTLNAFGDRTQVRNKVNAIIANTFDRNGRLLTETLPMQSVNSAGTVVASSVTNKFEYDARGNRTKMYEAYGIVGEVRTTTYVYDRADQLIEIWHDTVSVVSASDFVTTSNVQPKEYLKYDLRGNLIEQKDANGARTLFFYDRLDRKIAEISPVGRLSTFVYDANGNVTSSKVYGTAVTLPSAPGGTPPTQTGEYRETTYTYDRLDRVKTSVIANIRTGAWNSGTSTYATSVVTVTTSYDYDNNGNVLRVTDGAGGTVYSYYDKNNRKVGQVDQENYLTTWTLDGEGNVTAEARRANKFVGMLPLGGTAPSVTADPTNDRITNFTYDRNGRRLTEERTGVVAWTVNAISGTLSAAATTAMVTYTYNGLGLVTSKQEATGDTVSYTYDGTGRLTKEVRAGYTDQDGMLVSPTVDYFYNGLNNLTRTRQGNYSAGAGDRLTTYGYDVGGRLTSMTDAAGGTRNYQYDAAGNQLVDKYTRTRGDNTTVNEGILSSYDLAGRLVSQRVAVLSGTWGASEAQATTYNVYGEIASRAFGGVTQEVFAYDLAGRLWRTTSGDGTWRYFIYDANGNQTLAIESAGTDLSNKTIDQAITLAQGGGGSIGAVYVAGVNATINVLDKRGQAVSTRLPHRQLSGPGTPQTLVTNRIYNAFGELLSESDPRDANWLTNYKYNTMGRLIEKKSPQITYYTETSTVGVSDRPTETSYYDLGGRLVAFQDANATKASEGANPDIFSFRRALLAGTGYGGSEALVVKEFHPDSGVAVTGYDMFGDARRLTDELGNSENRTYDGMGRVLSVLHRGGALTDNYVYDLLGQRVRHWNSLLGSTNAEVTEYDRLGRVVSQRAFGGDTTLTSYSWNAALSSGVLGTFGGWEKTTTFVNFRTLVEKTDHFGRIIQKTDMFPTTWNYTYDRAGRLTERANVGSTDRLVYTNLNTGLVEIMSNGGTSSSTYTYDAVGNRLTEVVVRNGTTIQNSYATYDALSRMSRWEEYGPSSTVIPAASMDMYYDLNGNVRRANSYWRSLDASGNAAGAATNWDYWYRYDSMNRVTTDKGNFTGSAIVGGTAYTYNVAGQRATATVVGQLWQWIWKKVSTGSPQYYHDWDGEPNGGTWTRYAHGYWSNRRETFTYNADGTLASVKVNQDPLVFTDGATVLSVGTMDGSAGALKASFTYDAMMRMTHQVDWNGDGTDAAYDRAITYDATRNRISSETVISKQTTNQFPELWKSVVTNTYGTLATDALGAPLVVGTVDSKWNGSAWVQQYTTTTTNTFEWYDGAVVKTSTLAKTGFSNAVSTYSYGTSGILNSVSVTGSPARTISYVNDLTGQVLRRDESGGSGGNPHEVWYRFAGREMGFTGNNGTLDTDYTTSVINRQKKSEGGMFRFGSTSSTPYGEFNPSLDDISSYYQGGAGGTYTVRAGETLQSIAANLWGDASLWYKIAEANGLAARNGLVEGQSLILPSGVMKNTHNAGTFKPYDAAEAIGDTNPTNPKPKAKNKCGVFGQILLVAVAVAVTAITAGAGVAALAPGWAGITSVGAGIGALATGAATGLSAGALVGIGAAAAAVGSIASQGLGVATGLQDKFSWKQVAIAGLSGAIGGSLAASFPTAGLGTVGQIARGAIIGGASSFMTQGISVATGLTNKFSWAGVAAAAVGGGVSAGVGSRLGSMNRYAGRLISNGAGAIGNAAVRSLVDGSNFGDNVVAALPDVIGSTIGDMIADGVRSTGRSSRSGSARRGQVIAEGVMVGEGSAQFADHYTGRDGRTRGFGNAPWWEVIARESRNGDLSNFLDAYAVGAGGDEDWAQEIWNHTHRDSQDIALVADDLASTGPRGTRVSELLWDIETRWAAENPGVAAIWSTLRAGWNAGQAIYDGANFLANLNPNMPLNYLPSDRTNIYSIGVGARNTIEYLGGAVTGDISLSRDIGRTWDSVSGGVSQFASNAQRTYDLGGVIGLINRYSDDAGYIGGSLVGPGEINSLRLVRPLSVLERGAVAAENAAVRGPSGQFYSVAFETRLSPTSYPGVSRARHFQEANESLLRAIEGDADFARMMGDLGVNVQRTPTGLAPRTSPDGWTWHHAPEPGVMQLVPRLQHAPGSIFQGALHPNGQGGYSIWGKP